MVIVFGSSSIEEGLKDVEKIISWIEKNDGDEDEKVV